MLQKIISTLFGLAFSLQLALYAHETSAQIPKIRPPVNTVIPIITSPNAGNQGETAITLQHLQINTEISGSMAETTVEMIFFNPNSRVLEGHLQFPLLEGQQITSFALDINGKLRPAVPVEKAKGRQVFEEIERRGIDPALLEVTQGNNFKLRVYPIPAKGTRTVQLKYLQALPRRGNQWEFPLSLAFASQAQKTSIVATIHGIKKAPSAHADARTYHYESYGDGYQLRIENQVFTPSTVLTSLIPVNPENQSYVQEFQGETYFLIEVPIKNKVQARALPKTIGLLWDSSGSGQNRDLNAELETLDHYFKTVTHVDVVLQRLRDRAEKPQLFKITNGNWANLRKELSNTIYDGASALADWKPERQINEYLFFSDGLVNYGKRGFPTLFKGQRLYALTSASHADNRRLNALAENNGGRLIHIHRQSPITSANELLNEGYRVNTLGGTQVTELQIESALPSNELLRITGKLQAPQAEVSITMGFGNETQDIRLPITANAAQHPLAAYFWANDRLNTLEANQELYAAEIRRLGKKFSIPNSQTSLIVLENLSDYLLYEIEPPEELVQEFKKMKASRIALQRDQRRSQLENLVRQFQERIYWWGKDYTKSFLVKSKEDKANSIHDLQASPIGTQEMRRVSNSATSFAQSEQRPMAAIAPSPYAEAATAPMLELKKIQDANKKSQVNGSMKEEGSVNDIKKTMSIALKKWTANAPYIQRMKAASKEQLYTIYLDEKPAYSNSSAFFLDAADMLNQKGQRDLALRVLSNLAEMDLENRHILRILAYRLSEWGAHELAIPVLEKVLTLGEEEPQSYRDLGLAFAANKQYQAAIEQLNTVLEGLWDGRFRDIQIITAGELNAIIAQAKEQGQKLDLSKIDTRLLKNLPLDLRVIMSWDADNTDIDLWVTDPSGEKCYYGHARTLQGGRMSADVTQGYGPEEFSLRKARAGKYKIQANFYGNRQQIVAGATSLQVKLFTGFGTSKAQEKIITLRLKERGDSIFVGEFEITE